MPHRHPLRGNEGRAEGPPVPGRGRCLAGPGPCLDGPDHPLLIPNPWAEQPWIAGCSVSQRKWPQTLQLSWELLPLRGVPFFWPTARCLYHLPGTLDSFGPEQGPLPATTLPTCTVWGGTSPPTPLMADHPGLCHNPSLGCDPQFGNLCSE